MDECNSAQLTHNTMTPSKISVITRHHHVGVSMSIKVNNTLPDVGAPGKIKKQFAGPRCHDLSSVGTNPALDRLVAVPMSNKKERLFFVHTLMKEIARLLEVMQHLVSGVSSVEEENAKPSKLVPAN